MSVTSGFFNSLSGDRKYSAEQMSDIFDGVINDGIFASIGTAFEVNADEGNGITIGVGRAWFNRKWIYNDAILPITLDDSDVLLNRYDAVVIEVNETESVRLCSLKVIKGTPATNATYPELENSSDIHQYPLAYIYRTANSSEIKQDNITNMIGTDSTPYVTGILQVQSIEKNVAQWEAQWNTWTTEEQNAFIEWFDRMKDQLSADAAGNLQAQIDSLSAEQVGAATKDYVDQQIALILGKDGSISGALIAPASLSLDRLAAMPTADDVGASPTGHKHAAGDITSGTLGVARGGTGAATLASGAALIGNGTGAVTTRPITNLTAKGVASASTNLVTANSLVYHSQARLNRTTNVNAADTNYATYMARGIALVTAEPSSLANGACAFVYS